MIGKNALLRDADNPRIKRKLRELKHWEMILDQHREDHRIWELKEGIEQSWTCGEVYVECYAVETKIYRLIVTLPQLSPGRRLRFFI